jgi:hypothetical protein
VLRHPKNCPILDDFEHFLVLFTWQQRFESLALGFESSRSPAKFAKRFESSNPDSRICFTTITVDFSSVQTGSNQTNLSRERRSSQERRSNRERRSRRLRKVVISSESFFLIYRFQSFAQKCVRQKNKLSRILKILRSKIRFIYKNGHKSFKKRIDFFKIPGIST